MKNYTKKKYFLYHLSFITTTIYFFQTTDAEPSIHYDLTVVGSINFNSSIGRQAIGIIDCLHDLVTINVIPTRTIILDDIPEQIKPILENPMGESSVAILEDLLTLETQLFYKKMPKSTIKLAYTMFETTEILPLWVYALNKYFDAAIVPDEFLVDVYKNSGVTIPIFVLPLGIYIDEFLKRPMKKKPGRPFVFGCSTLFDPRKNHALLLRSFIEEFGNNPDVVLKLHGRNGIKIYKKLQESVGFHNITNVKLSMVNFSWDDYVKFMTSLDCYVSIAKGEGFGITPREAMALGIPCILSNNTAHTTICNSGLVYAIPSDIPEPAFYPSLSKKPIGNYFTCRKQDVRKALRDVYNNRDTYLIKAHKGRKWVQCYCYRSLKSKYLCLIKPQKVIFGTENKIEEGYLMTNSESLYKKYCSLGLNNS